MKRDMILWEVFEAIVHPEEEVKLARKKRPIKWVIGIILYTLLGVVQFTLWLVTIVPTLINKWVRDWRYI